MRKFIYGISLFAAISCVAGPVSALTTASGASVSQAADVKDVYAAGGTTLDLHSNFGNDVYAAGTTISIPGTVNGDLTVGGSTVTVTGEVKGGVRIAGGTVTLNSKVGKNVVLMGGTLTIDANADIAGEVIIAGGTVVINGHVAQSVNAWAGTMTINGAIDGPVSLHLNSDNGNAPALHVQQHAALKGDLTYWAAKDATIDAGAVITGVTKHNATTDNTKSLQNTFQKIVDIGRLWSLFSALVVGVLIALLFPRTLRAVADTMLKRSGASVGWGVLLALATPFAFIILMLTVIGIPLGLIGIGLYMTSLYLAQVFLGFLVGDILVRWLGTRRASSVGTPTVRQFAPVWLTLIGMIVISLIIDFLFGYLGGFAVALSFLFGIVHLFLTLWTFGAVVVVVTGYIRDRELK